MADFRAVSGVSMTLRDLLIDRIELPSAVMPSSFQVTIGSPRSDVTTTNAVETPRVNLFLYRLTENAELKNQMPPAAGPPVAYGHPPLGLNLHYLVTAFGTGDEPTLAVPSEATAQMLLASAMRVFNDFAIVTERLISVNDPMPHPLLHESLRDDYEKLRLSIEPLALEDLSKLWTALTLPLRLSAAYQVTAIQIESRRRRGFPLPVGELPNAGPRVFAATLRMPYVAEIGLRDGTDDRRRGYLRIGDIMVLFGRGFGRDPVRVFVDEIEIVATPTNDERVEFVLPDDAALQPGLHSVQLAVRIGPTPQMIARSNQAAFMLVPQVLTATLAGRLLNVTGTRLIADGFSGQTLLGRAAVDRRDYGAAAPTAIQVTVPDTLPINSVTAAVSAAPTLPVPSGDFRVRLSTGTLANGEFPRQATSVADAAMLLQAALRNVPQLSSNSTLPLAEHPAYRNARVGVAGTGLIVLAGGMTDRFVFSNAAADPLATTLGLTGAPREVFLSGTLVPFPRLTAASPELRLLVNGVLTVDVPLVPIPTSLESAVAALTTALATVPALAGAVVGILEQQLLLLLPVATTLVIGFVPSSDLTTARELQLAALYPVRVRVNGAESIDWIEVPMPT